MSGTPFAGSHGSRDASLAPFAFACPRCSAALASSDALSCRACRVDFPVIDRVPWLFSEPQAALLEWRTRADFARARLERDLATVERSIAGPLPTPVTRTRLEALHAAYATQLDAHRRLLAPLAGPAFERPIEAHLALKTRLPPSQGLTSYYPNLFRDWAWGDDENRASIELVAAAGPPERGRCLVMGAGAGRLAYDLHRRRTGGTTVALDFNPLLVLVGARIVRGETLVLHEVPIAPRAVANSAEARTLRAEAPVDDRFAFVLADALRAPFAPGSFDGIVTPWFVDVVDEDLAVLAARINALLAPGGRWIVFGSLAFSDPDPARCYGREEVGALVASAGFTVDHETDTVIPYMNAPGSRHARHERVVTIGATKTRAVAAPVRHAALPDWLLKSKVPVPLLPAFRTQAFTTRIYAFLMSLIDGRRTLADMAAAMAAQKLMPADEAEQAIRGFLVKMWDEARQESR